MDQIKTGALIRELRQKHGMTQLELAGKINVSDKAVSKWERGCGMPEVAVIPALAGALQVDVSALLRGSLEENSKSNGNLRKMNFYVCPDCGNLLFSTDMAEVSCCGRKLDAMKPVKAAPEDQLVAGPVETELFVTSAHEMTREHYISFVAILNGDTFAMKKQYPEWGLETRLPFYAHGTLVWYCTKHGLFYQNI